MGISNAKELNKCVSHKNVMAENALTRYRLLSYLTLVVFTMNLSITYAIVNQTSQFKNKKSVELNKPFACLRT